MTGMKDEFLAGYPKQKLRNSPRKVKKKNSDKSFHREPYLFDF